MKLNPSPPGRQARPPRVSVAGRNLEGRADPAAPEATGTNGHAGRFTSAPRTAPPGIATPPSSADETRWSSWTRRP